MYSKYQQGRLDLSRLFVGLLVLLIAFTGSRWETRSPMVSAVLFTLGCFLAGIATLGRLWCSLYIAGRKTRQLVTEGPYSICRHPLYFFSFLGAAGVGLTSETLSIPLLIGAGFACYYPYVIRYEERKMHAEHGAAYMEYCRQTPQFWPKWSLLKEPEEYAVYPRIYRLHLFSALGFIWVIGILELIEIFKELGAIRTFASLY